jgi:hypothetical protein
MQELNNIIVEHVDLKTFLGFGGKFDVPYNYVIYFEKEQNVELSLYIRSNYEMLKTKFETNGLNFIYLPLIHTSTIKIEEVISYYFPQLNYNQLSEKVVEKFNEKMLSQLFTDFQNEISFITEKDDFVPTQFNAEEILNLLEYKGNINSGLLFFKFSRGVIGVSDYFYSNSNNNYELFFDEAIKDINTDQWVDFAIGNGDLSIDLSFLPTSYSEQLDDDTKEVINDIENRLAELKDSGQLLFLIPILKDLLQKQSQKIDFSSISKMEIDYQNKIQLPYFKKEVELSHLTKSIYFLFLKHPEGINLKELHNFKKELLTIYTSVSNQLDHDKMAKSIDDVINLETKAIYTHLSRIKSAFYKIMDNSFAKYYIISGSGEDERIVLFNTKDIIWNNYERFTPDMF